MTTVDKDQYDTYIMHESFLNDLLVVDDVPPPSALVNLTCVDSGEGVWVDGGHMAEVKLLWKRLYLAARLLTFCHYPTQKKK